MSCVWSIYIASNNRAESLPGFVSWFAPPLSLQVPQFFLPDVHITTTSFRSFAHCMSKTQTEKGDCPSLHPEPTPQKSSTSSIALIDKQLRHLRRRGAGSHPSIDCPLPLPSPSQNHRTNRARIDGHITAPPSRSHKKTYSKHDMQCNGQQTRQNHAQAVALHMFLFWVDSSFLNWYLTSVTHAQCQSKKTPLRGSFALLFSSRIMPRPKTKKGIMLLPLLATPGGVAMTKIFLKVVKEAKR